MAEFSSLFRPALDFALPPRCPVCGVIIDDDHKLCTTCWQKLDFITEPWCASCGAPFSFERPSDTICAICLTDPPEHDGVRAVVVYDPDSSKIAIGLKYSVRLGLADLIASQLSKFIDGISEPSILVPVPLHRWRLWSRGFNQSVLIAEALSKRSDIGVNYKILGRRKATPPLRSMTAGQRKKTVRDAFELNSKASALIEGKTIILIDDIYTSGATANACSKLLKSAGANFVYVFCWARVTSKQDNL